MLVLGPDLMLGAGLEPVRAWFRDEVAGPPATCRDDAKVNTRGGKPPAPTRADQRLNVTSPTTPPTGAAPAWTDTGLPG
jgi:hypothetical protein